MKLAKFTLDLIKYGQSNTLNSLQRMGVLFLLTAAIVALPKPVVAQVPKPNEQTIAPVVTKKIVLPKALVIVGPWGNEFQWRKALQQQGILYDHGYRMQNVYKGGPRIVDAPATFTEINRYSLVLLINVDAPTLGAERIAAIKQFVEQGGGLVVLGGHWAFERGGYHNSPLAELLPVTCEHDYYLPPFPAGTTLLRSKTASWPVVKELSPAPSVYHANLIVPRENAVVEFSAGDRPALVTGTHKQGRVVACGLTIHGNPAEGELPFWASAAWLKVLGTACEWSSENQLAKAKLAMPSAKKTELTEDEIEQVALKLQAIDAAWIAKFTDHPSEPAAQALFEQAFEEKSKLPTLSPATVSALARFANPSWSTNLAKVADELNPNLAQRLLALELLGATKVPAAAEILVKALQSRDIAPAAMAGIRRLQDPKLIPVVEKVWSDNLEASDVHQFEFSSSQAGEQGKLPIQAMIALYELAEPTSAERLLKMYREVRLLRRIYANATKRRVKGTDRSGMGVLKKLYAQAASLQEHEQQLLAAAKVLPASQQENILSLAKNATDEADVHWLGNVLLQATPGSQWAELKTAKSGTLRRIGEQLAKP